MDLNKHIVNDNSSKPFHSNGFARIANGNRIGSVASTSFNQRRQVDDNRRMVGVYSRSAIGNMHGVIRARTVSRQAIKLKRVNRASTLQRHNSTGRINLTVNVPAKKTYDPYA